MGKILSVCSGSGGVGKSTIALAVAAETARRGKRTILLDASGIARSCDLMLGLESVIVLDLMDVITHQASIQSALYAVPGRRNLSFACASLYEGLRICDLSGILLALRTMCDVLVLDLPSGVIPGESLMLDEKDAIMMLVRPDDASIRALERLLSAMPMVVAQRFLLINRINKASVKKNLQYDERTVEMILDMPSIACIHEDDSVPAASKKGKTAAETSIYIRTQIDGLLKEWL